MLVDLVVELVSAVVDEDSSGLEDFVLVDCVVELTPMGVTVS